MSPQEQMDLLKEFGPLGAILTAILSVANLIYLRSARARDDSLQAYRNKLHEDGLAATKLEFEQKIKELRVYEDEQRHTLRNEIFTQFNLLRLEISAAVQENKECSEDRRDFAVALAKLSAPRS